MPYAKARRHRAHKHGDDTRKPYSTKKRTRDFDQIVEDVANPEKAAEQFTQPDEDLPGGGQFYCVECTKYFISDEVLQRHKLTAKHKSMVRRIKKDKPWTTEDARVIGVDNGPKLNRAPVIQPLQQSDDSKMETISSTVAPQPSQPSTDLVF